jgi:hypothetical protein
LTQIQGLSLITCKEALQGTMLEKMLNIRTLILHDITIKGFCTKILTQLQFFYWGKSQVARDVRIPFQMGRLKKLEMVILRAAEIDLAIKVRVRSFSIHTPYKFALVHVLAIACQFSECISDWAAKS